VEVWCEVEGNWINYLQYLKEPLAKIVREKPPEVTITNNLTGNLHLMMISFYRLTVTRCKILTEGGAFSSDQ
jgi:kynureninase